ncbi:asparagine synthase (glutamine-hydrolyzing) [Caballeronia ptereochthonis]|uniref:asparagine synthase (glutamine-hydrolyzing) n=1 Tax=Caballeronia ptereochthonis TaxID=1777144 RepID=A0A158B275_9BURK|nr:asparagine synthase (glutamine-hydrolyzing) [Caballeronia ptereochthonis]SAK63846.1 asparagine synthase [Caballeronia ptereochthonis]
MCGIAGFLTCDPLDESTAVPRLRAMCDSLERRGPDDAGYWVDAPAGVALGHRRLSIVDLSEFGHQPMTSACGRYVIVYNGEIYNAEDLRRNLDSVSGPSNWRGHSDTEVLLAAIVRWGIEETLNKAYGMFAFALWDRQQRVLTLGRDALGEKPLYYAWLGNTFVFGSELKALRQHPAFSNVEIDRDALTLYMRYCSIPAPHTIYAGVHKLLPGALATVRPAHADVTVRKYWNLEDLVLRGRADPFTGTEEEAVTQLDGVLREVLKDQMIADVPLGAFLSGGIDSSTVVALMQAQSARPIQTFSIGFDQAGFNEATHARSIARHLGTDHHELYVTPAHALRVVPQLPLIYDEPFADSSQIPTFLVSQMCRRHVTVGLSGDGGDEMFGGYNRHVAAQGLWDKLSRVPLPARTLTARCVRGLGAKRLDRMAAPLLGIMPQSYRHTQFGEKLLKLADAMSAEGLEASYERLTSAFDAPEQIVLGGGPRVAARSAANGLPADLSNAERMMYLDAIRYLPTDILAKVDRAAMHVSLETRVPFLDRRVVEFAWRLPLAMKVNKGVGKIVLRRLLDRYVPRQLSERPKHGFSVPIASWLRHDLREWASDLLSGDRLRREGYLNEPAIRKMWEQHLAGTHDWHTRLWAVLMFEAWMDANRSIDTKTLDLLDAST